MKRRRSQPGFEWTFSSRVRERNCIECRALTSGFLNVGNGIRKPLCAACFFAQLKGSPESLLSPPRKQPTNSTPRSEARSEQFPLCL